MGMNKNRNFAPALNHNHIPVNFSLPKSILIRDIFWHFQTESNPKRKRRCHKLLQKVVDQAELYKNSIKQKPKPLQAKDTLRSGMSLKRKWNNKTHTVKIIKDGKRFIYQGKEYKSLSRVAKVITGAHWSGPRFFGLDKNKCRK